MKDQLEINKYYHDLKYQHDKLGKEIDEKADYLMNHPVIKEYPEFVEWTNKLIYFAKLGGQVESLDWILKNKE